MADSGFLRGEGANPRVEHERVVDFLLFLTKRVYTLFLHCNSDKKMALQDLYFITLVFLVARRATYVIDGRFFGHYFWKVEGTVRIHVNSRVAPSGSHTQ